MKLLTGAISVVLPLVMHTAFAAAIASPTADSSLIEGAYFVTFNDPVGAEKPIVDVPVIMQRDVIPFGEHSTGQSKLDLEKMLATNGKITRIFDTMNSVYVLMDAKEAQRLSLDKRVKRVSQDRWFSVASTQTGSGWGLSRLSQTTPTQNDTYTYTYNGTGQTIYVLDSGLALSNPAVAAEFGDRAAIAYDFNFPGVTTPGTSGWGNDCLGPGHGTSVAGAIGSNTYGVAKGVTLKIVKVSWGCGFDSTGNAIPGGNYVATLNALVAAAMPTPTGSPPPIVSRGTIVNISNYIPDPDCTHPTILAPFEEAIINAYNAGIIVVNSAGNDGCNADNYTPSRMSQAFVVGGTSKNRFLNNPPKDATYSVPADDLTVTPPILKGSTRFGSNISAFAPAERVRVLDKNGNPFIGAGTSYASAYIAGIFAIACEQEEKKLDTNHFCKTALTTYIYAALKATATLNTVTNPNGTPLTGSTSRFIRQQW